MRIFASNRNQMKRVSILLATLLLLPFLVMAQHFENQNYKFTFK